MRCSVNNTSRDRHLSVRLRHKTEAAGTVARTMNIVLYTNSFLPHIGGRELVVHYLAHSFHALGHNVRVLGPAGWWRLRKIKYAYPVYRYPTVKGRWNEQMRLLQLLADATWRGCDVIHAHATYPVGYIAAKLKRIRNIPLVVTPHGADIHTIPQIGHGLRLNGSLKDKIELAVRRADAVTAISDSIEAALVDAGADRAKIHRIPNGVDLERFSRPVEFDVRAWLGLPRESQLLITVGNYHPRKGQERLIGAMPYILERAPMARLIIVGRNREALIPLINEYGLGGKVILTGQLDAGVGFFGANAADAAKTEDRLAALYANSDVYLSGGTAEGAEGLSLALLEAMAAGLPVVATAISGNRDIIREGENGFLVSPDAEKQLSERIVTLLAQADLRRAMGDNGRRAVEAYSWRDIAMQYLTLYDGVRVQHALVRAKRAISG